jgi:hypothetical protein
MPKAKVSFTLHAERGGKSTLLGTFDNATAAARAADVYPRLDEGVRVELAPFEDGDERSPGERGRIVSLDPNDWGISLVVQLDRSDRRVGGNDGLRECRLERIARVL